VSAQPAEEPEPAISALEDAFRQALATVARDRVISCVARSLTTDIESASRVPDVIQGSKVQKVSVSMPAELVDQVRARTGAGGFSRYVTESVEKRVRDDLLGELLDELTATYGPLEEDQVRQAMREWPDYQE
jgi:hypothetical protein